MPRPCFWDKHGQCAAKHREEQGRMLFGCLSGLGQWPDLWISLRGHTEIGSGCSLLFVDDVMWSQEGKKEESQVVGIPIIFHSHLSVRYTLRPPTIGSIGSNGSNGSSDGQLFQTVELLEFYEDLSWFAVKEHT